MNQKYMTINGIKVAFTDEKNILSIIRKMGIEIPTFCYYSDLSIYGACRMCVVEDQRGNIMASCSTVPREGMDIKTNTPKLQKHRKMILELLLSSHCRDCTTCEKNGNCKLQELAMRYGISKVRFDEGKPFEKRYAKDCSSLSIERDPNKCILCGDCVRMCSEIQNVGAIDFAHRGSNVIVTPAFGKPIADTECVNCGQCAAVCPTGAITIKSDKQKVWDAIHDPTKRVVAQIAPAVRVAIGAEFGLEDGKNEIGKLASAIRRIGFDRVYDTSLGADLTIVEEAKELVERLEAGDNLPLFTSCCPAWIRYVEKKHPEYINSVSTCKSPMQMFGAVIKEHYDNVYKAVEHKDDRELFVVAIMPCTAKKYEVDRDEFKKDGTPYVDVAITTVELSQMIREAGVRFERMPEESLDMPFGIYSGGGVIFGVTGGVTEAAVRSLIQTRNPAALREIEFSGVRGMDGVKEAIVALDGKEIRIAVVHGLAHAEELIGKLQSGEAYYDFIEVMACPGGCIGGAGQPSSNHRVKNERAEGLYQSDKMSQFKRSNENPMMDILYNTVLDGREHELLHVHYKH
ncbi:MAG: [FeFe] hydrogenase, group A [Eubacteriales bacterium]